jgi:YfiH family protein
MPPRLTHDSLEPMPHGFFGRAGGVSDGLYASLNCGLGSKDAPERVRANRAQIAAALGVAGAPVLTCHQVHSAEVVTVDRPWDAGAQPKADGLVTRTPGLVLGALAADCMPLLFADPRAGVIGAAHAGWRGALAGIAEATVAAMERLGARRDSIRVVIGPCISQAAYEVGPEFVAEFVANDPSNTRFFTEPQHGKRPHFDLPGYMAGRLSTLGLASAVSLGACTYAEPETWFSYRRTTHRGEPDYGRQISAITLSA